MYKIYSVESRKGGVGKTTIALNLAKALVDKGYDVLLIDCDITGTPITNAACHSPFWKDVVETVNLNGDGCNLIQYFEAVYLKGGTLYKRLAEKVELEKGKVHLLGSEIYDKKGKLIIDPRLLMDDLHSHWFVEMIKDIANDFFSMSESEKQAVILDNSPGYVGIGKSIREWLTSIGADIAHFILVSSLDEQDVESTISSAVDIERMMSLKWKIAYMHNLLVNNRGNFYDLKEILKHDPEFENFFYSLVDSKYPSILESAPEINNYVSVVLNRVPSFYNDANIGYKIKDGGLPERTKIVKDLFPVNQNGMPINVIEYDASISGQFIESNIYSLEAEGEQTKALDKACNIFLQRLGKYEESNDKVKQSASLSNSFETFKKDLIKLGYRSLIDSLGDNLVSQYYVKDLIAFVRTLGNVAILELDGITKPKENLQDEDRQQLSNYIEDNGLIKYSSALYSLFENIYKKAGFKNKSSNRYLLVNLSLLFKVFLGVQEFEYKKKGDYHKVLAQGYNDKTISADAIYSIQWRNILSKSYPNINASRSLENLFKNYFVEFYQKMSYSLLRLVECADDYRMIMEACRATVKRGGRTMDSDLRAYLGTVVSRKTAEFNSEMFRDLIDKPFEMQVVKYALGKMVLDK